MYTNRMHLRCFLGFLGPILFCASLHAQSNMINIKPTAVIQLTGGNNAADALFDEDLTTPWFPGWNPQDYPAKCRIDLGSEQYVEEIRIYDGSSMPDFYLFGAKDINDTPQFIYRGVLDGFQVWRNITVQRSVRYLYATLVQPFGDAQVLEMSIYKADTSNTSGNARGEADKINLCGFHWIPLDKLKPFSALRLYAPSGWMWRPDGLYVEPIYQAQTPSVNGYDSYLAEAKAQNLNVIPTINQTPDWYAGVSNGTGSNDYPPIKPGLSRTDPASYKDFAEFMWQMTARYGRVKYPDSRLRVDTTPRWQGDVPNQKKSGLDLLSCLEVWNEPDKWWKLGGPEADIYMQPEEYAALMSITFDSIKSADPSMKVIMAGLAGMDIPYLTRMKTWFSANRPDGKFAADAINVHHYCNDATQQGSFPWNFVDAGGISPEADINMSVITQVVQFAKDMGLETWVTEFGYDTYLPSWQYPTPVPGYTVYEQQAQWLVRSYLEFMRYDVDNMFMYNGVDEPNSTNGGLYQSCGLMYSGNHQPAFASKISYVKLEELIQKLTDVEYVGEKSLSNPSVRVMSFRKDDGKERIIYWLPTMLGPNTAVNFTLPGAPTLTATEWPQYYDFN